MLPQDTARRAFLSCYWVLTVSIVAIYTSSLVAFFSVKKIALPFETLEELAAQPDYQAGLFGGTATMDRFKVSLHLINTCDILNLVCNFFVSKGLFLSCSLQSPHLSRTFGRTTSEIIQTTSCPTLHKDSELHLPELKGKTSQYFRTKLSCPTT